MWRIFRRRCILPVFSFSQIPFEYRNPVRKVVKPYLGVTGSNTTGNKISNFLIAPYIYMIVERTVSSPVLMTFNACFTSSVDQDRRNGSKTKTNTDDSSETSEDDNEGDDLDRQSSLGDEALARDVETILGIFNEPGTGKSQAKNKLEKFTTVILSSALVEMVLSRLRSDWEKAFTFFLWAQKQPSYTHSLRTYHSMISILGKMRKFDTAWALINEMRVGKNGESLVSPQTLLIMIRRYCAVHEVGKAINTFYAHRLFKFDIGIEEFHNLLSALCRYKNLKDAEHLLFCNEKVFPFNTKSFNIVLNGWCNIVGNPREAKRIWKDMEERRVAHDVVSYSSIISCFSKFGNLYESLKLFNRMNELDIAPDRKVYNAVIHALAKGKRVNDACALLKAMEEKGIKPNAVSYNSLIKPLCKDGQLPEAREVFYKMLEKGVSPSVRTYHAFFRILRSREEVFTLLEKMKETSVCPDNDTYIMLIRKFSRWGQLEDALKLWSEIRTHGGPDRSSYVALINGLFLNGKLEDAYKYYDEMKEKQYLPEPEIDARLQSWLSGKHEIAKAR